MAVVRAVGGGAERLLGPLAVEEDLADLEHDVGGERGEDDGDRGAERRSARAA